MLWTALRQEEDAGRFYCVGLLLIQSTLLGMDIRLVKSEASSQKL